MIRFFIGLAIGLATSYGVLLYGDNMAKQVNVLTHKLGDCRILNAKHYQRCFVLGKGYKLQIPCPVDDTAAE